MTDTFEHSKEHKELIKKTKAMRIGHLETEAETYSIYLAHDFIFIIRNSNGIEKLFLRVTPEELLDIVKLPEDKKEQFERLAI